MSQENVEILRRSNVAFNRRDRDAAFADYHPDVEWRDLMHAPMDEIVNADFYSLKDFDTTNPKVIDSLIKCYKYWIATTDVDGYRIDTVRHVLGRVDRRRFR